MRKGLFITGAASGTGLAIAKAYAGEGYAVFLTSRRKEDAERAAEEVKKEFGVPCLGFACPVGDESIVKDIFRRIDEEEVCLSTLVLNAANMGFYPEDPAAGQDFWTVPVEDFRNVFETNLVWNFTIVRQAALRFREAGGGAVVFLSSNTAHRAIPNRAAYCASKGGINSLMRSLAVDLGPFGIRCNALLPGTIKTERWVKMGTKQIVNGDLTPIGDISDFQDVANAAFFLGTDLSRNITGTELVLDGGMTCQLYPRALNEWKKKAMEAED